MVVPRRLRIKNQAEILGFVEICMFEDRIETYTQYVDIY